jgi:hypothetical protein
MLEEGHKALEAMSAACEAIKLEMWGEAERSLAHVQDAVGRLLREVGNKTRETLQAPSPDPRDRG